MVSRPRTASPIHFDDLLEYIGSCGWWQWRNFLLLWLPSAASGLAVVTWAFTGFGMEHRCPVPFCDDTDFNLTKLPEHASLALPQINNCDYMGVDIELDENTECSDFLAYLERNTSVVEKQCSREDLLFDQSVVRSSLTQTLGLVCDRSHLRPIMGASYMFGMLVGSFVIGNFSDRFGRIKALLLSITLMSVAGTLGALTTNYIIFLFLRVITGMGGIGTFMISFVLTVECVGSAYTAPLGIAIEIPFAVGEIIFGLQAYAIRDWVDLQLVAYAPLILLLILYFVLDESPRWLGAVGRTEELVYLSRKAARINGTVIPEQALKPELEENTENANNEKEEESVGLMDMFKPSLIAKRSINMFFQWFSVTMCYYGLSFASTSLSGDAYSNFLLAVASEIPGDIFVIFFMDLWGRRPILSFCQVVSGLSCIMAGLLFNVEGGAVAQILLTILGKFCSAATFAIVFVYTAELFPTIIRSTTIGTCSMIARVGGITALLIQDLKLVWAPLPMLIMGVTAVIAGSLALLFPETTGQSLPETMADAINVGDEGRSLCTCKKPNRRNRMA